MGQQREEFRSISGYEGLYEVSNFGNVKSLTNDKILKPCLGSRGYYMVRVYKDNKGNTMSIHILVAMAFLGHKPDGYKIVVDHIDNNKLNNHVSNLQLISNRENTSKDKKNGTSKYTGVTWYNASNKWLAQIAINSKKKNLGLFETEDEAHETYQKALKMLNEGDLSFMKPKEFSSKYKGVSWQKDRNKWVSRIKINGKQKNLGSFTSEEDAADAYQKALKMYHEGDSSFMETKTPSSQYKGVCWYKSTNKWISYIKINGKTKHLGLFTSEEEAYEAYQNALKEKMNTI